MIRFAKPFINLNNEEFKSVHKILNSGWVSNGEFVLELEKTFEKRFHVKYAIACNNATNGLIISLIAAGWENYIVGLPCFTWPSTEYAIRCSSNIPRLFDIDKKTWLVKIDDKNCEAAVVVDTFGNNYGENELSIPVIYDAAHGFGLEKLGNRGLAEVVSLSHTKVVTAGEGGIILTNDDNLADKAIELRRLSSRMPEINALIALNTLRFYDSRFSEIRKFIIDKYLKGFDFKYETQEVIYDTNFSVFAILFEDKLIRDYVVNCLEENLFETKVYYEPLVFSNFPNTNYVYDRILALPVYYELITDLDFLIETINKSVKEYESKFCST